MTFSVFHEGELSDFLSSSEERLKSAVEGLSEDHVLGVEPADLAPELASQFAVDPPLLDLAAADLLDTGQKERIRSRMTASGHAEVGVYTMRIPFTGDAETLRYKPSTFQMWSEAVYVEGGFLCIDLKGPEDGLENQVAAIKRNLESNARHVQNQIGAFNTGLVARAQGLLDRRRKQVTEKRAQLGKLSIPIRRKGDVPSTFTIPAPVKKPRIVPPPPKPGVEAHPTLPTESYRDILTVLFEVAKQLERLPSTYAGKDEEALRDFLLLFLETHFEGSATGETFNRKGKTDILLRYQGQNVFVAECKFWDGQKRHADAVDQLLNYLTWRDTKTALIVFAKQKVVSEIVTKAKDGMRSHDCFVSASEFTAPGWETYRFHLPGDEGGGGLCLVDRHPPCGLTGREPADSIGPSLRPRRAPSSRWHPVPGRVTLGPRAWSPSSNVTSTTTTASSVAAP